MTTKFTGDLPSDISAAIGTGISEPLKSLNPIPTVKERPLMERLATDPIWRTHDELDVLDRMNEQLGDMVKFAARNIYDEAAIGRDLKMRLLDAIASVEK